MRSTLLSPVPALIVVVLMLLAVLPWGGPDWLETAFALLPIGAIYFWSVRRPRLLPAVVVFALGLMLDVMAQGPLGVWASAALLAALAGRFARQSQLHLGWVRSGVYLIATLGAAATLVAALTSLNGWQMVPVLPVVQAFSIACLSYPLLAVLLSAVERFWPASDGRSLFLRGD